MAVNVALVARKRATGWRGETSCIPRFSPPVGLSLLSDGTTSMPDPSKCPAKCVYATVGPACLLSAF